MNKEELIEAQKAIEDKFNSLTKQKNDTNEELFRLQGEYRLLQSQLDKLEEGKSAEEGEVTNG